MNRALLVVLAVVAGAIVLPRSAAAQEAKVFLVAPSGGTYTVKVHPAFVTELAFGEKLSPKALASDIKDNYDVKPSGDNGVTVRPLKVDAAPANLNVVTTTGSMKVSIVLKVVTDKEQAYTLVTFKPTTEADAFEQRVADEVTRQTESLRVDLATMKASLDKQTRARADEMVAARALARLEIHTLKAIERNDDNVIVRVPKVVYLGDDALLYFDVENRDARPYRLDRVQVMSTNKDVASAVHFASDAQAGKESLLGVVAAGGRGTGIVVIRQWAQVLGRSLTLVTSQPGATGRVAVDKIVLR